MKTRRFGFTLIELLVVIAFIVILAAIIAPAFFGHNRPLNNRPRCFMVQPSGLSRDIPCPSF